MTVLAAIVPLALSADQGRPLSPVSVIQLEGGVPGQAPVAAQVQAPQAQTPLPPVAVTQIDEQQLHPELDGERISLAFTEPEPVRNILLLLADQTGLSIIPDPGIDATWIGDLKNVTLREALDLILEPLGLDYSVRGNIIRVFPRELETRLFSVDYVITQRGGNRSMSASTGASGGGGVGGGGGGAGVGGAGGAGGGAAGGGGGGGGGGGSSSSVSGTDGPNFFDDLETGIRNLLSADGSMNLDRTAALLQVTDRESRLDRISQYLDAVMLRVTRQVQIEARIIEVELNERFEAGINWSTILRNLPSALSLGQTLIPAGSGGAFTLRGNVNDNFEFLFSAFNQQGRARVLSSPRVTAMNNQPAIISAGTQRVFFTSTEIRDPQGLITQSTSTPQTITVGVVLSVTPQISADGIIHLSMNPSVTEATGEATSRLGDVVPIINQRTTDTLVRVREGETIVIAGLMQDREVTSNSKVPVLGDLPFIGGAFKSTNKNTTKSDLVIMLTPTLMGPAEVPEYTSREIRRIDSAQRAIEQKR